MVTPKIRRRVKRELSAEKPRVWIGKNGISQEVIAEVDDQLERTDMIKVRILKSALEGNDAKAISKKIAQQTGSALVEVRGHTFMLYRRTQAPKKER